jgi:MHS family proline/betaine transporter-like MFS transporter
MAAVATRSARNARALERARSHAPAAPRRKSGPVRKPRPVAAPAPAPRVARAGASILLDRLLRGRAWVFLVGALLAGSVWIARSTMEESPEFHRQVAARTVPANPLRHSLTHHRGAIGRAFAISALGSITYYVGITYVPVFLTSAGGFSEGASLWLSTAAAVIVILVPPFVGLLSDRIGRKPVLAMLAAANIVLPITLFSLMAGGSLQSALLGALVLAALAGGGSAVGAVATAEQFPGEARVTGLALGATGATAIFGGLTPWLAQWLVERTGWDMAPGAMIALVGLAVLPLFVTMKETAPPR